MGKHPLVRTIYLYIFALLGLTLVTIGSVRFLDMGLKTFVFTKADEDRYVNYPPSMPYPIEKMQQIGEPGDGKVVGFTEEEKIIIMQAVNNYKIWLEKSSAVDPVSSQRQRDASINLALILVGLPLYLYHWRTIARETKRD